MALVHDAGWAETWQRSWDRLEEDYVPDRELRIRALLDAVDAIAGTTPTVIDLACGTGTITRRLLERFPAARSIAVDVDPVLLTIASATFAADDRVRIVHADLRDPAWVDAVLEPRVDAVLTATALHWLPEGAVHRVYRDLAGLVRAGGVVAHAEEVPLVELPHLDAGLAEVERERRTRAQADGRVGWDAWWQKAARDPALRFAGPAAGSVREQLSDRGVLASGRLAHCGVERSRFRRSGCCVALRHGRGRRRRPLGAVGDPRGCMPREEGSAVSEMITALIVALSPRPSWFQRQCCRRGEGGGHSE